MTHAVTATMNRSAVATAIAAWRGSLQLIYDQRPTILILLIGDEPVAVELLQLAQPLGHGLLAVRGGTTP